MLRVGCTWEEAVVAYFECCENEELAGELLSRAI